jgi:hypothetical protein
VTHLGDCIEEAHRSGRTGGRDKGGLLRLVAVA